MCHVCIDVARGCDISSIISVAAHHFAGSRRGAEAVPVGVAPTRDRNLGSRVRRFAFFIPAASGAAPELKSVEKTDLRIRGTRFSGGLHMKPRETAELLAFTRPVHFFVAPPGSELLVPVYCGI